MLKSLTSDLILIMILVTVTTMAIVMTMEKNNLSETLMIIEVSVCRSGKYGLDCKPCLRFQHALLVKFAGMS